MQKYMKLFKRWKDMKLSKLGEIIEFSSPKTKRSYYVIEHINF